MFRVATMRCPPALASPRIDTRQGQVQASDRSANRGEEVAQATSVAVPAVTGDSQERPAEPAVQPRQAQSSRLATLTASLVIIALVTAVIHFVITVSDYSKVFVHPEVYQFHLPQALRGGYGFGFHDVVDSLQFRELNESRPRWGAYLLQAVDLKLRLRLYQWLPVHPTFSPLVWLIQLVVGPYFLYRLLALMTRDRIAAL